MAYTGSPSRSAWLATLPSLNDIRLNLCLNHDEAIITAGRPATHHRCRLPA